MQANISIFPVLHKHRIDRSGLAAINLRIDLDNSPAVYDKVGERAFKIAPQHWDERKRQVAKSHPNAAMINLSIDKRRIELEGVFMKWEHGGGKLTKALIKQLATGRNPGQSFVEFCTKQIRDKYYEPETIRTYKSEVTKIESFRTDVSFRDIDFIFLQEYAAWMREVRRNKPNTIWKTFKFMNTMMNDALKVGGIIKENPFDNFDRGKYKQTPPTFLRKSERIKLEEMLSNPMPDIYRQVLSYFLFMCYCGLRYEDALSFNFSRHVVDNERIIMDTQKKDYRVNIKLFPKLRELVAFITAHPISSMTNQAYNKYLAPIVAGAGINKKVTAHVGRHTFGRLLAETGIDKTKAQRLLGHHDSRSTDVYYHIEDEDIDREVEDKLGSL